MIELALKVLGFLRALVAYLRGAQDQAKKDQQAADTRAEVEDEIREMDPAARRDDLGKWVR